MARYRIVQWHKHQHYKDRCPPWIKLHHSLLTSEIWVLGDDATRTLAIASMLLAARNDDNDGTFNGDPEYIKRFAYLNTKPNFKPLLDNGFIELVQDASTALAICNTEQSRAETENNKTSCASSIEDGTDDIKNPLYTKAFLAFWDMYPTRKNKGDAAKAFSKIKPAEYPAIKSGLIAAKESCGWNKDNGQFIPHPGTWLRARGWEDEQTPQASNGDSFLRKIGAIP